MPLLLPLCRLIESHKLPLYGVAFNYCNVEHRDLFATTGSSKVIKAILNTKYIYNFLNPIHFLADFSCMYIILYLQATVYRCLPDGSIKKIHVLQDADSNEEFYVCRWSIDVRTGSPLLLLAGKNALLQVFDFGTGQLVTSFEGHGHSINDIAVHPTKPHLVVTASKDHCLRLWNLHSRTCILVFQGDGGHRSEVLCADWRLGTYSNASTGASLDDDDLMFVSGGMDNRVKIWDLTPFRDFIEESNNWDVNSGISFPARDVEFPLHNYQGIHWNYVDCIKWFGPALLSKSVSNTIICWLPNDEKIGSNNDGNGKSTFEIGKSIPKTRKKRRKDGDAPPGQEEGEARAVATLRLEDTKDVWWMRFSLDFRGNILAQGTSRGAVLVYRMHPLEEQYVAKLKPRRAGKNEEGSRLLVRQTAVSFDAKTIVCCHEDGSLTRYDAVETGV
jgi:polycomb protein EED